MDILCYPIGHFTALQELTEEQRKHFIESIAGMTDKIRQAVGIWD